jgi:hypothetical protein
MLLNSCLPVALLSNLKILYYYVNIIKKFDMSSRRYNEYNLFEII